MHTPSLCLAETITSLIETKTIADIHFARGRSSRDERSASRCERPSTIVVLLLANRVPVLRTTPRRKSKEVEIGGPFSALDLPECIRLCRVVVVETFLTRAYTTTKLSARTHTGGFDIPFYPAHIVGFILFSLRRSTHERVLGGLLYICMGIRKHAYMFAHTRSRSHPSNPLIGFIRASSITFSQGYTPLASPSSDPTTRIYRGNFAPTPTQRFRNTHGAVINAHKFTTLIKKYKTWTKFLSNY